MSLKPATRVTAFQRNFSTIPRVTGSQLLSTRRTTPARSRILQFSLFNRVKTARGVVKSWLRYRRDCAIEFLAALDLLCTASSAIIQEQSSSRFSRRLFARERAEARLASRLIDSRRSKAFNIAAPVCARA